MSARTTARTTARVIGDALVLDLGTADTRSVWRCSMEKLAHAGFGVKVKNKKHFLVITTSEKEEEIAAFSAKEEAEKALGIITDAFMAHRSSKDPRAPFYKRAWFYILLFLILMFIFFSLGKPPRDPSAQSAADAPRGSTTQPRQQQAPVRPGVPIPADQLFGN
ncbi:MAG: hypothetical protein EA357_09985 [Micavibrio sp.]|nr:MAG: hypothetical protein EA357_09985 [Micavibrio sp.]